MVVVVDSGPMPKHTRRTHTGPPEDDCARLESGGVALAEALREAAPQLWSGSGEPPGEPGRLAAWLAEPGEDRQRRLVLAVCPQAVILAVLLRAGATGAEHARHRLRLCARGACGCLRLLAGAGVQMCARENKWMVK